MNRLRCVIIDDDVLVVEMLKDYCSGSRYVKVVGAFNSPDEFLKELPNLDFDMALLDICMPGVDGFEVARIINGKSVVFITGNPENLAKATNEAPIDLISKPVKKDRLDIALERAYRLASVSQVDFKLFNVVESDGQVKIKPSDIIYVKTDETERRRKHISLKNGEHYTIKNITLDELLKLAPTLIQLNKKELVSIDAFAEFDVDRVAINGINENGQDKWVIMGRKFKREFKKRIGII